MNPTFPQLISHGSLHRSPRQNQPPLRRCPVSAPPRRLKAATSPRPARPARRRKKSDYAVALGEKQKLRFHTACSKTVPPLLRGSRPPPWRHRRNPAAAARDPPRQRLLSPRLRQHPPRCPPVRQPRPRPRQRPQRRHLQLPGQARRRGQVTDKPPSQQLAVRITRPDPGDARRGLADVDRDKLRTVTRLPRPRRKSTRSSTSSSSSNSTRAEESRQSLVLTKKPGLRSRLFSWQVARSGLGGSLQARECHRSGGPPEWRRSRPQ